MLGLSACVDPGSIKDINYDSSVVVFADLNPDSLFNVMLIRTSESSNIPDDTLRDADVKIFQEEEFVDQLFIPFGTDVDQGPVFRSATEKPKENSTYELRIELPDNEEITAIAHVPSAFGLLDFNITELKKDSVDKFTEFSYSMKGSFWIENRDEGENFYHFAEAAVIKDIIEFVDEEIIIKDLEGETEKVPVNNIEIDNQHFISLQHMPGFLIREIQAEATTMKIPFQIKFKLRPSYQQLNRVEVFIRHVDQQYYEYHKKAALQISTRDNPFAEPVRVPSNIKNGLGNFSGYINQSISTKFD